MSTSDTNCSPEKVCGHCHPEHIGQRCEIDHLNNGTILVTGSMGSGELLIDVSGPVPTVNGVRLGSWSVLAEMGAIFTLLSTQRAGLSRRDEGVTDAMERFPVGMVVEHVGSGRAGKVEAGGKLGLAHYTNVYNSVQVRVRLTNGSVAWFRPADLRRIIAKADAQA